MDAVAVDVVVAVFVAVFVVQATPLIFVAAEGYVTSVVVVLVVVV
jgi:hypothetical protein